MMASPFYVEGNLDLRDGWGEVFSTPIDSPTLVILAGTLTPGRSYTFALTATNSSGSAGYAGKLADIKTL